MSWRRRIVAAMMPRSCPAELHPSGDMTVWWPGLPSTHAGDRVSRDHGTPAAGGRTDRSGTVERGGRAGARHLDAHCDALRQKLGVPRRRQIPIAFRLLTGEDPLARHLESARADNGG